MDAKMESEMSWSSGLQLRVIDGQRERRDRTIRLDGKELKLGRANQGQRPGPGELLFKEPTVSRAHATLTWKPLKGGFQLVHKSKTNPTLVNGKPTKKILLAPGDRVQMGLLILELEDAPGGRTSSSSRSSRSSMTEPIMEALSKVEREHEEDQRRTRAEREEKQRQRELLASPESQGVASSHRSSTRLDEALKSAPFDPQAESVKRKRSSGFGWQPPEEREEEKDYGWGGRPRDVTPEAPPVPPRQPERDTGWGSEPSPPAVAYDSPPPPRRTIPITTLEEKPPPKVQVEHDSLDNVAVYELVVAKGPDQGKTFALKDMVLILGQRQGDQDERGGQGVLLNDATLPGEIGMFVWQGREGSYGLLASENSMQIIEVERIERDQKRRIRVDSHSPLLLKVADEIQVGLTTLRVQKIGEPLPDIRLQRSPQAPEPTPPAPRPIRPEPEAPGRPTSLRAKPSSGFGPPTPSRPMPPPSRPTRPEPPPTSTAEDLFPPAEEEDDVPLWAAGTLVPGSASAKSQQTPRPASPLASGGRSKPADIELLEWGNRPNVDFLLEFVAGPLRGCQISLGRADLERMNRLNAGCQGGRQNEIGLEGPDITNEAFHLVTEDGRFSLCNESLSGLLVVNRSPMKTGDRVVLMTGDIITISTTKIRFLERDVVNVLSRYGLQAESGVTPDQDRIFPLNRQRLLIGRGKACDVRLSDLEVSRVHLGLAYSDGKFSVQHRSETNPTFLNGLSLLPGTVRKVKEGDRIRLSSLTVLKLVKR
jgi:pSer/pThr/pTyr-binding forkhead associated (FHA) protein